MIETSNLVNGQYIIFLSPETMNEMHYFTKRVNVV